MGCVSDGLLYQHEQGICDSNEGEQQQNEQHCNGGKEKPLPRQREPEDELRTGTYLRDRDNNFYRFYRAGNYFSINIFNNFKRY